MSRRRGEGAASAGTSGKEGRGRRRASPPIGCGARATARVAAPPGGRGRRSCRRPRGSGPRFAPAGPPPPPAPPAAAPARRHRFIRGPPFEAVARGQGSVPQHVGRPGVVSPGGWLQDRGSAGRLGGDRALGAPWDAPPPQPFQQPRAWAAEATGAWCRPGPRGSQPGHPHHAGGPGPPSHLPSPAPLAASRQESGPVCGLCQVLFYSVPTETPGEGAASGRESRHSGGGGTARYGTVRHGTGSLRVAQSTADTHTVTMFRGSAPGVALTAANGARGSATLDASSLQPPLSPQPWLADCHDFGLEAWPGRVGYGPPVPAGREARWRMRSGGETGPGGGLGPACD